MPQIPTPAVSARPATATTIAVTSLARMVMSRGLG